ncbi:MAG: DUF4232 domain-containing protein [Trebonia sp.]
MSKVLRFAAAGAAALTLGIGSAVWATSGASAASAATSIPKCTTSNLATWLNVPESQGTAGSSFTPLEFTNISGHECYLWGYPGVSAVSESVNGEKQLGDAAGRDSVYPARVVNLAPGATAHALLRYVDVITTESGCKPKDASFLKIYPEAQRTATNAFFDLASCTTTGKNWQYLMVTTVQPGV